ASRPPALMRPCSFFLHDPPPPDIYTLSLHDALPICLGPGDLRHGACRCHSARRAAGTARRDELGAGRGGSRAMRGIALTAALVRSEEHTSELQSRENLVCRLLLEKKNKSKEAK